MDAVKYIRERTRMFDSLRDASYKGDYSCGGVSCSNCPLRDVSGNCIDATVQTVDIVEKWSKEHPAKTIKEDFLEKYPKAKIGIGGTPKACPKHLGYKNYCDNSCHDCWNTPLEVEQTSKKLDINHKLMRATLCEYADASTLREWMENNKVE